VRLVVWSSVGEVDEEGLKVSFFPLYQVQRLDRL
jgi:hypothetical protein